MPALLAGLVLTPAGAFAQQSSPNVSPAPLPPATGDGRDGDRYGGERSDRRAEMRAFEADRTAMRSSILNALTPDHRRFLATLAGELATSPSPDLRSAVSRLDDQLSPQEKTSIVAAAQAMRDKMRARYEGSDRGSAEGGRNGEGSRPGGGAYAPPAPDAGRIVLGTMLGIGSMGGRGGPPRGSDRGGPPHGGIPMGGGQGGPPPDDDSGTQQDR